MYGNAAQKSSIISMVGNIFGLIHPPNKLQ